MFVRVWGRMNRHQQQQQDGRKEVGWQQKQHARQVVWKTLSITSPSITSSLSPFFLFPPSLISPAVWRAFSSGIIWQSSLTRRDIIFPTYLQKREREHVFCNMTAARPNMNHEASSYTEEIRLQWFLNRVRRVIHKWRHHRAEFVLALINLTHFKNRIKIWRIKHKGCVISQQSDVC